ncbi:MAG TPA: GGDEF domain-containing protein [Rhizobacter sp.]|nr:GGDEF domain-containing protein [Rhizobacter sp.]
MDPTTVIVMLAIHLVASGGLMYLVSRLMPDAPGLVQWAAASTLFGLGYLVRLSVGMATVTVLGLVSDAVMIFAVLLFADGLRRFTGRASSMRRTLMLWAPLVVAQVAVALIAGVQGRHVGINVVTGGLYVVMTVLLACEIGRQPVALHAPLRLLGALLGGLGALTLLRAYSVATQGMEVAFQGLLAKIFYMYASFAALGTAFTLLWLMFVRLNTRLAEMATRDALTGVLNRNGLDQALRQHFAQRGASAMSLLLVDIDHFKRVNDTLGHAAGDSTLRSVAQALLSELRAGDFVARMGGEEFLIGCVGAPHEVAMPLAQRLRDCVGQLQVPIQGGHVACTVSVGVSAGFDSFEAWEAAMSQADEALYRAKAAGRDAVQPFVAMRVA